MKVTAGSNRLKRNWRKKSRWAKRKIKHKVANAANIQVHWLLTCSRTAEQGISNKILSAQASGSPISNWAMIEHLCNWTQSGEAFLLLVPYSLQSHWRKAGVTFRLLSQLSRRRNALKGCRQSTEHYFTERVAVWYAGISTLQVFLLYRSLIFFIDAHDIRFFSAYVSVF